MTTEEEQPLPAVLAARLLEVRRQQISALYQTEQMLLWLGYLPAEKRALATREERRELRRLRANTTNA